MIITLRQPMTRIFVAIAALFAFGGVAAQAQNPDGAAAEDGPIETIVAVVHGLSHNDLLNVRATASPLGLVLARIPNGTMLTRLECATSRNTQWCRVEVPELDGLVGWTPARYLHFSTDGDDRVDVGPAALPVPPVIDPSQITVGILPDPLPMPEDPLAFSPPVPTGGGGGDLQTVLLVPAPDGPAVIDAAGEARKIEGSAAELALAYATRRDPASSEVYSAFEGPAEPEQPDGAFHARICCDLTDRGFERP
ncbi:SH3 domain-containing protein, partial [Aquibium carbonis]